MNPSSRSSARKRPVLLLLAALAGVMLALGACQAREEQTAGPSPSLPNGTPKPTAQVLPSPSTTAASLPYPWMEIGQPPATRFNPTPYPPEPTPRATWKPSTPLPTQAPLPRRPTREFVPLVTVIPVAEPPFIPGLEDVTPQPFHIIIREGNRVSIMNDDGTDERLLIDTEEKANLYLGHSPRQGTEGPPLHWGSVSPDGTKLALVVTDLWKVEYKGQSFSWQVYLFDTQTEEFRFLAEGREPVWSPDGSRIAFAGMDAGLWVVDIESNRTQKLFSAREEYWVRDTFWSPDGQRIAFVHELASMGTGYSDILWIEANRNGEAILLLPASELGGWSVAIAGWSRDGRGIFYQSGVGEYDGPKAVSISSNLWFLDIETGQQSQLTRNILAYDQQRSPDGEWIVLSGPHPYESESWSYSLWLLGLNDSALYRLTSESASDLYPVWSPDGTQIVFRRVDEGIWVLNLADGGLRQVYAEDVDFAVTE